MFSHPPSLIFKNQDAFFCCVESNHRCWAELSSVPFSLARVFRLGLSHPSYLGKKPEFARSTNPTLVSWWLSGDPRSTHIAPGASLLRYLSQEWKVINHLSKAHESLFYIGVINDNKFMKVRRLSRVNSRGSTFPNGNCSSTPGFQIMF